MKASMLIATFGFTLATSALAQHSGHGHHGHAPGSPTPAHTASGAAGESDWVEGEVRRVDREQGRITLRHGEIRSLDMPPMTMVFHAADPRQLDGLTTGDRVRFRVVADGSTYRLTAVERR